MRPVIALTLLTLVACGSDTSSTDTALPTTAAAGNTETTVADTNADTTAETTAPVSGPIVNTWVGPPIDPTALPLGDAHVSTTGAAVGDLFVCDAGDPNAPGAFVAGPWINEAAGTWDMTQKVEVRGAVNWATGFYREVATGDTRTIESNGIPVVADTGEFPIAADDPAYAYDRNPNSIAVTEINVTLPLVPEVGEASCLPKGIIGVTTDGVALFAPVDAGNRDAVAWETQDLCDGHPQQQNTYHYHNIPSCVLDTAVEASTVVGYAYDGFPIVVERDASGNLPTNADLDECHGRISPITMYDEIVEMYHYSVTLEFPYFIGCYRGAPVA